MKRSPLIAMAEMAQADGDITMGNQFVRGQSTKRGDEITMGMPGGQINKIASGKYIICLFLINAEQLEHWKAGTESSISKEDIHV